MGPPRFVYSKGEWLGVNGIPCSVHSYVWLEDSGIRESHIDVSTVFEVGWLVFGSVRCLGK